MFLRDWLHSFRTPTTHRRSKHKRHPVRLQLERLEDRLTPTTTIDVANATDLQSAIGQVNHNDDQYILNFAPGTYDMPVQLTINNTHGVTLQGNGASLEAMSIPPTIPPHRVFQIGSGSNVVFQNLTIQGGVATDDGSGGTGIALGGGILDLGGNVTLTNVIVQSNSAVGNAGTGASAAGGGIYVLAGTLTITGSIIQNNAAIGGSGGTGTSGGNGGIGQGGGVASNGGTLNILNSSIAGNRAGGGVGGNGSTGVGGTGGIGQGGGVAGDGGAINILNSSLTDNHAQGGRGGTGGIGGEFTLGSGGGAGGDGQGGGLWNSPNTAQMINTTVATNTAQGGAGGTGGVGFSGGGAGGTGGNGQGGGVYEDSTNANSYLNDTVAFNTASAGAGGATGSGGASGNSGTASGGGFFVFRTAPVLTNTILESNTAPTGPDYFGGVSPNSSNNFVSNASGADAFDPATNILNVATPQLGAAEIAANGTTYYPVLLTSQIINAGTSRVLATIAAAEGVLVNQATDQAGRLRFRNGPSIDIGAGQAELPTATSVMSVTATFSPAAQTVTLSATVTSIEIVVNEGTVTFTVTNSSGTIVGTVTGNVSGGQATAVFTVPAGLPAGIYTITAAYDDSSTGNFQNSTGTGTLTILSAPSATTVTNVSVPFTNEDPNVTLTATVTSGGAAVNEGQVQFMIAGLTAQPIVVPVVNGQASTTFSVPPNAARGNYAITATFVDSTNNFASSAGTGTLTVFSSPTTVTINNVSIVYGLFGVQETLTAVARNALGVVVNEGFVTFSDGGQTMTAPIINGLATVTLNIPFFSENPFAHNVSLAFGDGTGNFLPSTSLFLLEQTVRDFLLQLLALFSLMQSNSGNT